MRLRTISLFTGAGGMDVGAINSGFEIVAANEIDPHACNTYRANHPSTLVIEGDIEKCFYQISEFKNVDLVIGGPPCQGFSVAGKMDPNDPRSKLIFSYAKVIEHVLPKAFIMENVKSLGTLEKFSSVREKFVKRMLNAGYSVRIFILNAKDFGVPQSRERVFFIGMKGNNPINSKSFSPYHTKTVSLREAIIHLGKVGSKSNPNRTNAKITLAINPILRKSPYAGMLFNGQGRPLNPDIWASTLPATMGGNRTPIIDEEHLYDNKPAWIESYHKKIMTNSIKIIPGEAPSRLRRLTIDEAALLQTFPSNYNFIGPQSKIFCQIGNAVPCKLAEIVAKVVKDAITNKHGKQRFSKVTDGSSIEIP